MRHSILIGFMVLVFVAACQARAHSIDDDEEASGERPGVPDNGFGDDEDFDTEGSGSPVVPVHVSTTTEGVVFETESTTLVQESKVAEKKKPVTGDTRNVVLVDNQGSEGKGVKNTELEQPEKEPDSGKATADEVNSDPVAPAGASLQFTVTVIVGGCIGLLFAVCVIMLLVYRMRKKDEGSYALDYGIDKKPQGSYEYTRGVNSKEYFA